MAKLVFVFVVTLAGCWSSAAAFEENVFVGRWKIDPAKSQFAGSISSIKAVGPNTWTFHEGTFSWTVKSDGTPQSTPFGETIMKIIDSKTWQFTETKGGKTTGVETWALNSDDSAITWTLASHKENGEPFSSTVIMKRIAGKSGFEGSWESTEVQLSFTEVDIASNGEDGITLTLPEDGTTYSLKFDGKEYPEHGPRLPSGVTVAATRSGTRTVNVITRLNGKLFDHEKWELSEDGKTFTYIEHDVGSSRPVRAVLHRIATP